MKKHRTVSVIIPNYNNGKYLEECINSCLIQKGDFSIEIIVVDDHSTDNSLQVLEKIQKQHPQTLKVFKNPSKGGNSARIYGFNQSKGGYIQWLDSDDLILEGKFNAQIKKMEDEDLDVVFSDSYLCYYDKEGRLTSKKKREGKGSSDFLLSIIKNQWNPIHSYLFCRKIVEKTIQENGWNVDTQVGQDREFVTIAAITGGKFGYLKGYYSVYNIWFKPSVSKVSHKESILQTVILNKRFYNLILKYFTNVKQANHYLRQLNTELVRSLYYVPKLKLPRKIPVTKVNWKAIDKRIIPFVLTLLVINNNLYLLRNNAKKQ